MKEYIALKQKESEKLQIDSRDSLQHLTWRLRLSLPQSNVTLNRVGILAGTSLEQPVAVVEWAQHHARVGVELERLRMLRAGDYARQVMSRGLDQRELEVDVWWPPGVYNSRVTAS